MTLVKGIIKVLTESADNYNKYIEAYGGKNPAVYEDFFGDLYWHRL